MVDLGRSMESAASAMVSSRACGSHSSGDSDMGHPVELSFSPDAPAVTVAALDLVLTVFTDQGAAVAVGAGHLHPVNEDVSTCHADESLVQGRGLVVDLGGDVFGVPGEV